METAIRWNLPRLLMTIIMTMTVIITTMTTMVMKATEVEKLQMARRILLRTTTLI
ncbi:MAG: hypothetical protein ABF384_02460 [Verrucomicrobiales bacterium]